jgi:hypothetical protein
MSYKDTKANHTNWDTNPSKILASISSFGKQQQKLKHTWTKDPRKPWLGLIKGRVFFREKTETL